MTDSSVPQRVIRMRFSVPEGRTSKRPPVDSRALP